MAYHDELIRHAGFLSQLNLPDHPNLPDDPKQADLRRAVSAAYYALFHLLTTEAAQNWKHQNQRNRFARIFDHGRMKTCSLKVSARPFPTDAASIGKATDLKLVADSFVTLQQARHTADYDNSKIWSRTQVYEMVYQAKVAMFAWMVIRESEIAQDYLFDLLGTK
jgi:uncharacterized protein (UPF0332 family)